MVCRKPNQLISMPPTTAADALHQKQSGSTISQVVVEMRKIGDISIPVMVVSFITYLKNMTLVMFMGQLGSLELAGGALAIGFTNITGYSVLSGLSMGMEPLCSQAFGSNNHSLLRATLRRTILMLLATSIPISFLWLNIKPLLLLLHQDPEIVETAAMFCRFAAPDLAALSLLHPLRICLRCKGVTWPLMWCNSLSLLLHFPITYALTFTLQLGLHGLAVSTFVADFITLFSLIIYLSINANKLPNQKGEGEEEEEEEEEAAPLYKPLITPSRSRAAAELTVAALISFDKDWIALLKFSIPSCLGVCLEWWWYELMTLLAGYLRNPRVTLATCGILIQTTSLLYTLPNALSSAASTRVGTELGAGNPGRARLASAVATTLSAVASILGLMWTTLGREMWARLFTDDPEILELTMTVLPLIGLCELANCPQTTGCGVLRGCGRPGVGAGINLVAFYVVGGPVALGLGFVMGLGLMGLCCGLLAAQVCCFIGMLAVLGRTDWEMQSAVARELVGLDMGADCGIIAIDLFKDVEQGAHVCT
uniref:Protein DETOXIFICATION n=1 Tax=Kalanchoe fedtschenkoi TaxID=63787 RepID=A0A7N0T2A8_KALFE